MWHHVPYEQNQKHTSLTHPLLAQVEFFTCKADISREHIRVHIYRSRDLPAKFHYMTTGIHPIPQPASWDCYSRAAHQSVPHTSFLKESPVKSRVSSAIFLQLSEKEEWTLKPKPRTATKKGAVSCCYLCPNAVATLNKNNRIWLLSRDSRCLHPLFH